MKTFLLILTVFDYFREGNTLNCYQCHSETNYRCLSEETVLDTFLKPCPPPIANYSGFKEAIFCMKLNQWLYFTKKMRTSVVRGCTNYHTFKEKCFTVKDSDAYQKVCVCNTEGCNSVPPRSLSYILWLSSLSLVISHMYFMLVSLFPT